MVIFIICDEISLLPEHLYYRRWPWDLGISDICPYHTKQVLPNQVWKPDLQVSTRLKPNLSSHTLRLFPPCTEPIEVSMRQVCPQIKTIESAFQPLVDRAGDREKVGVACWRKAIPWLSHDDPFRTQWSWPDERFQIYAKCSLLC